MLIRFLKHAFQERRLTFHAPIHGTLVVMWVSTKVYLWKKATHTHHTVRHENVFACDLDTVHTDRTHTGCPSPRKA